MKVIEFGGQGYLCPFSERFRRHTPAELDGMRRSVAEKGVRVAVRIYRDTDLDGQWCILDGEGRLTAAIAEGLEPEKVPVYREKDMGTDDAYDLARTLNDERRHDDPEEVRRRRKGRVAELRAEGKSLRAIAEEVGASHEQVRKDITESGVNRLTGDGQNDDGDQSGVNHLTPETVTGRDGKEYPATRPETELEEPDPPESGVNHLTPEPDDAPPQPSSDASRPNNRPSWMVPGGKAVDPNHPFADILKKFTALSAAITTALRGEHCEIILEDIKEVQQHSHQLPMLRFTDDRFDGESFIKQTVKFIGLQPLRGLFREAGVRKRKRKPGEALRLFRELLGQAEKGEGEE